MTSGDFIRSPHSSLEALLRQSIIELYISQGVAELVTISCIACASLIPIQVTVAIECQIRDRVVARLARVWLCRGLAAFSCSVHGPYPFVRRTSRRRV
jgi:hypothetical protein